MAAEGSKCPHCALLVIIPAAPPQIAVFVGTEVLSCWHQIPTDTLPLRKEHSARKRPPKPHQGQTHVPSLLAWQGPLTPAGAGLGAVRTSWGRGFCVVETDSLLQWPIKSWDGRDSPCQNLMVNHGCSDPTKLVGRGVFLAFSQS
jgi:hypothetical protein